MTRYHVKNATLYVYLRGVDRRPQPDVLIEVFKVYKNGDHTEPPGFARVASKKVQQPLGSGDWAKVDVTVTVSEWFKNMRDNYGFVVNGTVNGRRVSVTDTEMDGGSKVSPARLYHTLDPSFSTVHLGKSCFSHQGTYV